MLTPAKRDEARAQTVSEREVKEADGTAGKTPEQIIAEMVPEPTLGERQPPRQMRHRWLVFILREGGQLPETFAGFDGEDDARRFYAEHSVQWSDSYLCRVVKGPAI